MNPLSLSTCNILDPDMFLHPLALSPQWLLLWFLIIDHDSCKTYNVAREAFRWVFMLSMHPFGWTFLDLMSVVPADLSLDAPFYMCYSGVLLNQASSLLELWYQILAGMILAALLIISFFQLPAYPVICHLLAICYVDSR